ncbi:MAG TPA: hypothetical protein VGG74_24560 [Kofleriaceae bacterium]|jgi:hypothetical protein
MSCACGCGADKFTKSEREAALARYFDGEPKLLLATRLGICKESIRDWDRDWDWREGIWENEPLTEAEHARGWHIVAGYGGRVRVKHVKKQPSKQLNATNGFLYKLAKHSDLTREDVESSWQALSDAARQSFAPAYDLAIEAIAYAELAKQKRDLAMKIASVGVMEVA